MKPYNTTKSKNIPFTCKYFAHSKTNHILICPSSISNYVAYSQTNYSISIMVICIRKSTAVERTKSPSTLRTKDPIG